MILNKLLLNYKPEPEEEDVQETTKMKLLVGKWEPYRKGSSFTDLKFRMLPEYDRLQYVKREFKPSIQECHNFVMRAEELEIPLSKDHFFGRWGSHYWDIVLIIPKKAIDVHKISQSTEFFVKKISEENYSYLIPEITSLRGLDGESALRLASTLEEAMNISKLEADNPFQKRIIEDFQWNMIEIKKIVYDIVDNVNVERARRKLIKRVHDLENKISAVEEIRKAFGELGIDEKEALKEFAIKELPSGRVELVWKKSG